MTPIFSFQRLVGGIVIGIFCLLFLLAPPASCAQDLTTSAYLTGTVTDSSGAVIPKAQVTVSGVDNGVVRKVTTDATGTYTVSLLPPATYTLSVDHFELFGIEHQRVTATW